MILLGAKVAECDYLEYNDVSTEPYFGCTTRQGKIVWERA